MVLFMLKLITYLCGKRGHLVLRGCWVQKEIYQAFQCDLNVKHCFFPLAAGRVSLSGVCVCTG